MYNLYYFFVTILWWYLYTYVRKFSKLTRSSFQITDHLFQGDLDLGLDLVALNIQRGRDHGLPPYNDWREVCGLKRVRDWKDLIDDMDPQSINRLATVYPSVDEVDLFVGAVSEKPAQGAMLGPTFVCLVGDQFARLRRADRFFYEESNQLSTFSKGMGQCNICIRTFHGYKCLHQNIWQVFKSFDNSIWW